MGRSAAVVEDPAAARGRCSTRQNQSTRCGWCSAHSRAPGDEQLNGMQRLLAITALTWKAAFRFRLFWVLAGLLLGSVVALPILLKDDGTARGFIQIMLTYTLSLIAALAGFSAPWLGC